MAGPTWADELRAERKARDALFADADTSPLAPDRRGGFPGLSYFPPDPRYDVRGVLHEQKPAGVTLVDNRGREEVVERVGRVRLILPEGAFLLTVFHALAGHGDRLLLPFRDRTSGSETAGLGRVVEPVRLDDRRVAVDLNRARHPVAVHNPVYASPLPPRENELPIALRVGERLRPSEPRFEWSEPFSSASRPRPSARRGSRLLR